MTLKELIRMAYVVFAGDQFDPRTTIPIEGGPPWLDSANRDIAAKSAGPQSNRTLYSLMLQTLLEDRLHLKPTRRTRDIPVYALTIMKGGHKLQPFQPDTCIPVDFAKLASQFPPAELPDPPPGAKYCKNLGTSSGPNIVYEAQGTTLDELCRFAIRTDRPVVNRTGLAGRFDVKLEFAESDAPDVPAGPSIFTALQQQLGLKLEPAKGPGRYIAIVSVERPSKN